MMSDSSKSQMLNGGSGFQLMNFSDLSRSLYNSSRAGVVAADGLIVLTGFIEIFRKPVSQRGELIRQQGLRSFGTESSRVLRGRSKERWWCAYRSSWLVLYAIRH